MPDDYYVSQYSGEEIDERLTAAHNAVRYDAAQSLTDEQKAQARTNIGADAVQGAVRYDAAQTLTDAQKTQARNNISAMQGIESTDHPGCCYVLNGSTVEWVNPPMQLGVEYRTTERYLGKPVYKKLLLFTGAMTDGYSDMAHNIANIANVVGCYAELFVGSTTVSTPVLDGNNTIIFSATQNIIRKTAVGNYSEYSARVLMSYTKTTD